MDSHHTGHVVVGIDDSLCGLQALRWAVAQARARGLPLKAVRVWQPGPSGLYPTLHSQRDDEATAAAQLVRRMFADTMGGIPPDLQVETVAVPDATGPALVRIAREDDLLVIGTGRRRFWRRRRLSRTARYCVSRANCPVLVVPPPSLAREASQRALLRELRRDLDRFAGDGPAR